MRACCFSPSFRGNVVPEEAAVDLHVVLATYVECGAVAGLVARPLRVHVCRSISGQPFFHDCGPKMVCAPDSCCVGTEATVALETRSRNQAGAGIGVENEVEAIQKGLYQSDPN